MTSFAAPRSALATEWDLSLQDRMFAAPRATERVIIDEAVSDGRYRRLSLIPAGDRPERMLGAYRQPGQYLALACPGDEPGYFAIASSPAGSRDSFEVLIRDEPGTARSLFTAPVGTPVESTAPAGAGYPVEDMLGLDLLILAAGSGIAPIRAFIDTVRTRRQSFGWVRLYYGEARAADIAFDSWLLALADDDIDVHLVLSRDAAPSRFAVGHVQTHADHPRNVATPTRLGIVVCGMEAMETDVTGRFTARGVRDERIFRNI